MRIKYLYAFLVLLLLFSSPLISVEINETPSLTSDALTSGSLNGVDWTYGNQTYFESGNHTEIYNGTVLETTNTTVTRTQNVKLVNAVNTTPIDAYYLIRFTYELPERNETFSQWYDIAGFETWVANVTGYSGWATQANYSTEEAILLDQNGDYLTTFEVNTTYFEYINDDYGFDIPVSGIIIPKAIFFQIDYEIATVEVTQSQITYGFMAYYAKSSFAYNISATAHQVNITNGENFAVGFQMFDNISANYTQFVATWFGYHFTSYQSYSLKYANGTDVAQDNYPLNMRPSVYTTNGSRVDIGYQHVESKILSTYQNIFSLFVTTDSESTEDSLAATARLALWGISTSTTMVAYDDLNNNDQLDISLGQDGLNVQHDFVSHIGLAEAYNTKVYTAAYTSHNYSLAALSFGVNINETHIGEGEFTDNYEEFGFGNVDGASDPQFSWADPVEDDEGNVVFAFGMSYNNFPVTWVSTRDGSVVEDNEDIAYDYVVRVNPATGRAKISTTWTYGGVVDSGLAAKMVGKSLSLMVRVDFFALQAVYTASASNETVDSTTTRTVSRFGAYIGGRDTTEIDVSGPKQFYLQDGTNNETATFNAIRIVTVAGSFSGERVSPFESESETSAGTAVNSIRETLDVEWFYSLNLLVINYPTWDGKSVEHDPDYSLTYAKVEVDETTDSSDDTTSSPDTSSTSDLVSSTPTSTTPSSTPSGSDSSTTDDAPAPAVTVYILMTSFVAMVIVRRRR